jgi:TolB-like protein/tetratricopeptide (TPR) repeat protein
MTLEELDRLLPDRYRIIREIGRGGMATVYLAEDVAESRDVAVKVLSGELGSSLDGTRFLREIKIAGELTHPNILQAYDSGSAQGILFYVMPFVEGLSVRARLDDERLLPIDEAVRITVEVCDALAFAHERGIVHRDIKPENILLEKGHAIVADFGIARLIAEQGGTLTQTGMSLGTAQYMSPEQASAEKVDGRSDIYSLGCVLYEMIVGEPPFTGPNAMAVLARSVTQPVPSIRVVRSSVPEHIEYAIMQALEKVPVDRYQTVTEFKNALLSGGADSASVTRQRRAYTAPYRAGVPAEPVWRRPRAIAAGAALALLVAGGAGFIIMRSRSAAARAAAATDAKRIAVMYFDDTSPNGALRYIADGVTESLIDDLDRVPTLQVLSKSAVRPFRGQPFVSDSVHKTLGAGTIVRGEVGPGSKGASVTVQLVDGVTGSVIKRGRFDFDTANVGAANTLATSQVAEFLRQEVGLEVTLKESRLAASTPQAWLVLQRAEKQVKDADSLIKVRLPEQALPVLAVADSEATRAVAVDGAWAKPWITRAAVARARARALRDRPALANASLDSGRIFAERALSIDPRSADAHEMRGGIAFARIQLRTIPQGPDWDNALETSDRELREAVRLDPQLASAYETLSYVAYARKRVPEALQAAMNAYTADAYLLNARSILNGLFRGNFDTENFPEARRWCDEGHRRFPRSLTFVECSMYLMMTKGTMPEPAAAARMADTIRALAPPATLAYNDHFARTLVGGVIGKAGMKDSANAVLVAARADREVDPMQEIIGIEIEMRLMYGDFDGAIARLGDYLLLHPDHRQGLANQTAWYWRDPRVQNDPRFQRLIAGAR